MQQTIQHKLRQIESQQKINLLWAVESGSRAWGFASEDSDYDVRAIYLQPATTYLDIDAPSESFEWIENEWFDVGAWDIRKALRLIRSSNSVVLEWLQSPIIYQGDVDFHADAWQQAQAFFQPKHSLYHYRGIAKTASQAFATDGSIKLKKWFYVLRPLLAALWVAQQQQIAPMTLDELMVNLSADTQQKIQELVWFKQEQNESFVFTPSSRLQGFIADLWQQTDLKLPERELGDTDELNQLFRTWTERYVGFE